MAISNLAPFTDATDTDGALSRRPAERVRSAVDAVDMNDEKLIEEVRKYRVLYDISDPKYNNPRHKDHIWRQIGRETRQPESSCKKRWNNIRDNFRKSRRKRSLKTGKAAKTIIKYKFEDRLQFLIPFFREREKISQVSSPDLSEHETEGMTDAHKVETDDKTDDSNQSIVAPHFLSMSSKKSPPSVTSRENSPDATSPILVNYFSEKLKQEETAPKVVDMIDSFLSGIGMTLRTFPDYHLNIAKSRIFEVVQEMEMKLIMERQYQSGVVLPKDASAPGASET